MLVKIQCPGCGANMEIDEKQEKFHCKYCGIEIANVSEKKEVTQNINVNGTIKHVYEQQSTERKKDPEEKKRLLAKWKKILSRFLFGVVCILAAILLLGGAIYGTFKIQRCAHGGRQVEAEPTATPEPTAIPNRWYDSTKNPEHAPDLDLLGLTDAHREDYAEDLSDPTRWIDLTPEGADGFTVIRSIDLGCSYVVQNGAYYRLGEGEDGKGALDVHLTDLDWDGEPDLLYTYHFGANEDQASKVGWFDLVSHESALSGFSLQNGFLAIAEEDGAYALYRAERDADLDTGTFSLTFTERLGVLVETEGRIFLILE